MVLVKATCLWCGELADLDAKGVCRECRPAEALTSGTTRHAPTPRGQQANGYCHGCGKAALLTFWSWSKERGERVGFCEEHGGKAWSTGKVDFGPERPPRVLTGTPGTRVKRLPETAKQTRRVNDVPSAAVRSNGRTSKAKALRMKGRQLDAKRRAQRWGQPSR